MSRQSVMLEQDQIDELREVFKEVCFFKLCIIYLEIIIRVQLISDEIDFHIP